MANTKRRRRRKSPIMAFLWPIFLFFVLVIIGTTIHHDLHLYDYSETVTVWVEKGDTLWSIARPYSEGRDIRRVIDIIEKESDCGATIYPGDVLYIPVFD